MKTCRLLAIWIFLFTGILFWACDKDKNPVGPPEFDVDIARQIQADLDAGIDQYNIPGAAIAVRSPDGATWFGASGLAIRETGTSMTPDTHVRIGSVTKTFTATVVLQLVDEDRLSLDDTIDDVLPIGIIVNSDRITVRQLLEMRSGLGSWDKDSTWMAVMYADPMRVWTPEELIEYSDWTQFEPGERYDYNNANYTLLGMMIETVTGNSYQQEVHTRILEPLNMTHTVVPTTNDQPEPFAHGYLNMEGTVTDFTFLFHCSYNFAAGEMISTVADQLIWIEALMNGDLISEASHAEQFNIKEKESDPGRSYGLGLEDYYGAAGHLGNYFWMYGAVVLRYKNWDFIILGNGQDEGGDEHSHAYYIFWDIIEDIGLSDGENNLAKIHF